jgi:hypothetical protein
VVVSNFDRYQIYYGLTQITLNQHRRFVASFKKVFGGCGFSRDTGQVFIL